MTTAPSDLLAMIEAGTAPAVLDVRSRWEFSRGHVPGAMNVPLQKLIAAPPALAGWRERPIVVYCGHGPRAQMAAVMLRRHGFHRLSLLAGHMAGWRRAGFPQQRGPAGAKPQS
jgi:hydroxyacylglutathione hydrolase